MESKSDRLVEWVLMALLGVPVVGVLMGGAYSLPAIMLAKGREPWLTGALAAGLAVTAFGVGYLGGLPLPYAAITWAVSVLLLLGARRLYGSLDNNIERFGGVHALTLVATVALCHFFGRGFLAGLR